MPVPTLLNDELLYNNKSSYLLIPAFNRHYAKVLFMHKGRNTLTGLHNYITAVVDCVKGQGLYQE